jgi:hypothetical protein
MTFAERTRAEHATEHDAFRALLLGGRGGGGGGV